MIKICFVCLGNICRSPMAEFIMKDIVNKAGKGKDFYIVSKATHSENIWRGKGAPIYPPARRCLKAHGIPFDSEKEAALLEPDDYFDFDFFIGMDKQNLYFMHQTLGGDPAHKIHALMEYTPRGGEVADPWYTRNFERAFADISEGCEALFEALR